jgi:RNA polymerase sigma factor (sigma-70 family)
MFRRTQKTIEPATADLPDPALTDLDTEARLDERLISNARDGDLASFNTLVNRHERVIYNVCLRTLRDASLAEDATQDTFIKAWTAIDTFWGGLVRPWLLRIATNRCYDILRAKQRRPADSLDAQLIEAQPDWSSQSEVAEHPEAHAARHELSVLLDRALGELADDQRIAIVLSDIQGYAYDEIAAITGTAIGTVKSRLFRARARLREILLNDPRAREHLGALQRFLKSDEMEGNC